MEMWWMRGGGSVKARLDPSCPEGTGSPCKASVVTAPRDPRNARQHPTTDQTKGLWESLEWCYVFSIF